MKSLAGRPKIGRQVCTRIDSEVFDHVEAVRITHGHSSIAAAVRHILVEATKRGVGLNENAAPGS